jgi:hypothetical protein
MKNLLKCEKGFTYIEVTISIILIMTAVIMISTSFKTANNSKVHNIEISKREALKKDIHTIIKSSYDKDKGIIDALVEATNRGYPLSTVNKEIYSEYSNLFKISVAIGKENISELSLDGNKLEFFVFDDKYIEKPIIEDGLKLWLDAADELTINYTEVAVTSWRDKSGNNLNLEQINDVLKPSYEKKSEQINSGIRFNNDILKNENFTLNSQYTVFLVASSIGELWKYEIGYESQELDSENTEIIPKETLIGLSNSACNIMAVNNMQLGEYNTTGKTVEQVRIYYFEKKDNNNYFYGIDGELDSLNILDEEERQVFSLGTGDINGENSEFKGVIHELIVYDRRVKFAEKLQIESYLNKKWK